MLNKHDAQYHKLVTDVLQHGVRKPSRPGIDTLSVFGRQMRFDLRDGTIPMLTTKKMFTRGIIHEILWYLMGTGNISYLKQHNVTIWDEWADHNNDLGPVYGVMWRKWPNPQIAEFDNPSDTPLFTVDDQYVDQIANLVHSLKHNPTDRRMIVSGWNPALLPDTTLSFADNVANGKQALPPCHYTFQCYTAPLSPAARARLFLKQTNTNPNDLPGNQADLGELFDNEGIPKYELSLMLNQRSCDVGLGVPFNIVQYSILLRMLAEVANMIPGEFVWNGGDVHIYTNHVDGLREQLTRTSFDTPTFSFARRIEDIDDFKYEDFVISGYQSHQKIELPVAV